MDATAEAIDCLRAIIGDDTPEATLRAILLRSGGDISAAANSFFDGGASNLSEAPSAAPASQVGDDVLGALFKTLEDQGRKLAGSLTHAPNMQSSR